MCFFFDLLVFDLRKYFSASSSHLQFPSAFQLSLKYFLSHTCLILWSQDSSVGLATGYGLDDRGVGDLVPLESRIFSSPRRPDRLLVPPNLLSNGYRGFFPGGKAAGA
jgi:hypothetical protein